LTFGERRDKDGYRVIFSALKPLFTEKSFSAFIRRPLFEAKGTVNVYMLEPNYLFIYIPETGEKGFALYNIFHLIGCNFFSIVAIHY
jgi:hypothetical protein